MNILKPMNAEKVSYLAQAVTQMLFPLLSKLRMFQ